MSTAAGKAVGKIAIVDIDQNARQNAQGCDGSKGDSTVSANQSFTFAEGYGLSLIARNPRDDWSVVLAHLSHPARQIADAIISYPQSASTDAKAAAKELMDRAGSSMNNQKP